MMSRALAFGLALVTASLSASSARPADIRPLPYPFGHMITFSSDVDYQAPWHGNSIHRYLNEELGLPITDSFWISSTTGADDVSALFRSYQGLSTQPSRVDGHSVYGLLLRQWHRGNIDTIHSWSDDMVPQYRHVLPEPQPLSATGIALDLTATGDWMAAFEALGGRGSRGYQQLRMIFDREPPKDLVVEARFADGKAYVFSKEMTSRFRSVGTTPSFDNASVTIVLNEPWPTGPMPARDPPFPALSALQIKASSCAPSCAVKLIAIERDNFSRWSVLAQKPALEALNIRPTVLTSHGGHTYHPDFEGPGEHYRRDFNFGDVRLESIGLAGQAGTHGYYADILRELGFRSVTSIMNGDRNEAWSWHLPVPAVTSIYPGFYALSKTHALFGDAQDSLADTEARLAALQSTAAGFKLEPYVCTVSIYCRASSQGSVAGAEIALDHHLIEKGVHVEHQWYIHFGTVRYDPTFTATPEAPFPAVTMDTFRDLSRDYYNPAGDLPESRRVWVPAGAVWANYRIMRDKIPEHVAVDAATSEINITPFADPVLGQNLPDARAGTRDLHGITIYVPHAEHATVKLDGKQLTTFTRNPADSTGRESITIVDDDTPATVFNRLPPDRAGKLEVANADYSWQTLSDRTAEAPPAYARLVATSREATLKFSPSDLQFFNVTHLSWSYRIRRDDGTAPRGRLAVIWHMGEGATVAVAEGAGSSLPQGADTGRWVPSVARDGQWHTATFAQHDFLWAPGYEKWRAQPLVLGEIRSVEIKLVDAAPGDILEIGAMQGLRPSGNAVDSEHRLLLAGRVLASSGQPQQGVEMTARMEDGTVRTTATDASGYYVFGRIERGAIVAVTARTAAGICAPRRGDAIELRQNEAELDIDLGRCNQLN
ncbi:hypothetical protein FBZ93_10345 [Bradyrhizobium macuxiense]|uniref:Carboxypeptidase regulatory-like domain-containing protein n=1 Tax=Bradyrhizobium macuxiense TaxID=1755647 RepID=A0A560MDK0_9BRAD|nr:carboxypeptidase-like regulatory domain-containing protein [Bradyrhizobium macuxiense]TWC05035.1 hypothetical protein FBZ93_10345 [Bradyrhizobium macuxiense]